MGVICRVICRLILWVIVSGVFCAGDSVTLPNYLEITRQDKIRWFFNNTRIAEMDLSSGRVCTDVQCNDGTERFKGRLKLDHQTGNLTIMKTTNTDSGDYKLEVVNAGGDREKTLSVKVYDDSSLKKGESVTLHNNFKITSQDRIRWYFKNTRIAAMDLSNGKSCTDVQCNEGTERFRGRLKLDHQTGNLTIMKTTNADSGEYQLEVIRPGNHSEETFIVMVLKVTDNHENPEGQTETSDSEVTGNHENPEGQTETSDSDSGRSAGIKVGIFVALLLVIGALAMISHRNWSKERSTGAQVAKEGFGVAGSSPNETQNQSLMIDMKASTQEEMRQECE